MTENPGAFDKEAIRKYAEEKFGKEMFIEQITGLYNEVITNRNNG